MACTSRCHFKQSILNSKQPIVNIDGFAQMVYTNNIKISFIFMQIRGVEYYEIYKFAGRFRRRCAKA